MASREETIADHWERLNRVLVYIEDNMDGPLLWEELASLACFSPFHFHRIFAAYVGETINEYIRRIRLERAANRLAQSGDSVTSAALAAAKERKRDRYIFLEHKSR